MEIFSLDKMNLEFLEEIQKQKDLVNFHFALFNSSTINKKHDLDPLKLDFFDLIGFQIKQKKALCEV